MKKERREGYADIVSEIRLLGQKVDANTVSNGLLGKRMLAVENVTSGWTGGLKVGRWVVGTMITIGGIVGGWWVFGK